MMSRYELFLQRSTNRERYKKMTLTQLEWELLKTEDHVSRYDILDRIRILKEGRQTH